ncbi:MAG: hypothetical protein FWE33_02520 [Defluviitaleaceae bacterium]|nr:hypothetical protein [Defluviitaleaceae bacterium]
MILNYNSFLDVLLDAGFSMGGGNDDGIYAIINWGWNEAAPYKTPIVWHCGDPDIDPWEWRMRVLHEHNDIAYAKLFFKKSGFITRKWYPYFLAVRRPLGLDFDEAYESGIISHAAKRIYTEVATNGMMPTHEMKKAAGFGSDEKSIFDKALTELQMGMFLTMCGKAYKSTKQMDNNNAWASTVLCTTETFFPEAFAEAEKIDKATAIETIKSQILTLNPNATDKKIQKFITG